MYFLGIDSGGTKTTFLLINQNGEILETVIKGTGHYLQIGFDGLENLLINGLNELLLKNQIKSYEIAFVFLGIPGYSEVEKDKERIDSVVKKVFKFTKYRVENDVFCGWAGALACSPGINIVSGTGSIAVGINEDGKVVRSGGWGSFVGDEASAFWIARKGIEIYSKQADFRLPTTKILEVFKENLQLEDKYRIIDIISNDWKEDREKVAQLSKLVSIAAQFGDEYALEIFNAAANEIFLMIHAIERQLDFTNPITVSYSGGVFKSGNIILNPLNNIITKNNSNIILKEPILSPVVGAALFAYKLSGNIIDDKLIQNLIKQDKWK